MNIPPHQLDEALRRVQQGLMQPAEAAKWLLEQSAGNETASATIVSAAAFDPESPQPSTIATLLEQLGPPPEAIQRDWDEQLLHLATAYEQSTGRVLPELNSHDILVDPNNRLSFSDSLLASLAAPQRLADQRDEQKEGNARHIKSEKASLTLKHRWLKPAAILLGAAGTLGLTLFVLNLSNAPISTPAPESRTTATNSSSIFSPATTSSPDSDRAASKRTRVSDPAKQDVSPDDDLRPAEFQFADNTAAMMTNDATSALPSPNTTVPKPAASKAMLGLDSFAGGNWVSGTDLLPAADFDTNAVDPTTDSMPDDPMADEDSAAIEMPLAIESTTESTNDSVMRSPEQADEADQAAPDSPTNRSSGVTAVELPAWPSRTMLDEEIETAKITDEPVSKVELLFPIATAISLASESGGWVLQDDKDQSPLARLIVSENELGFRWTALAAMRPIAKQVPSAMLSLSLADGTSRPLFLRPVVTADAWPIDLTTGDARAAWPISTSVPSGVSRLYVEFQLPETVIQTWVQPHAPEQFRRSQSIIEFRLDSDSKIAIRSRLELKTGTRITSRMRHAAQLDPSFPWQLISVPRIQAALEQVTMQLDQASAAQEQIKVIYYKGSSTEKKVLGPQRDAIDAVVLRLRELSERLTKYDLLLSQLEHAAHMMLRLEVEWPDTAPLAKQVVFEMDTPPNSSGK